jgi:hypothetical protein
MNPWLDWKLEIKEAWNNSPEEFLQNRKIKHTMHPNNRAWARMFYDKIQSKDLLESVKDPDFGKPNRTYKEYSLTTLQQMFYFERLEEYFDYNKIECIVDVGAGYGNFYRLVKQLGYNKEYRMIDFPELLELQEHYINNTIDQQNLNYLELTESNITPPSNSLLYATFSISEMNKADRSILEKVYNKYTYIFITYNRNFNSISNTDYFSNLKEQLNDKFEIKILDCPVVTNLGHQYFIGVKRGII